ncbi:putative acetyltransferase [Frankia sp. AiPs1]
MVYVVRITRADIGARVMIRRRIPGPIPLSDVLGTLRSWSSRVLTVETAEGAAVQITEDDIVAARVVPARPPARRPRQAVDTPVDEPHGQTGPDRDLTYPATIVRTRPVERATIPPMTHAVSDPADPASPADPSHTACNRMRGGSGSGREARSR